MISFDVYFSFTNARGVVCPGVKPQKRTWPQILELMNNPQLLTLVHSYQSGNKDAKKRLPAVCWTGRCKGEKRLDEDMEPTQFVMLDIDHVDDIDGCISKVLERVRHRDEFLNSLALVHKTPSGHGLRLVFRAFENETTLLGQMRYISDVLHLEEWGKLDTAVKNLGRLSFIVPKEYVVYAKPDILTGAAGPTAEPITSSGVSEAKKPQQAMLFEEGAAPMITEEDEANFEAVDYRGTPLKVIVDKYIAVKGQPSSGEIHNFYNELVKNFRCIASNDKKLLLWLLPRFGHSAEECWSQIKSICRVNTLSRLPKDFFFFLKDNGYYVSKGESANALKDFMLSEATDEDEDLPSYIPPVFREFIQAAPKDFVPSVVNALLPILGTLTSYLRAVYPYDGRVHSTSFFSVIYAPPGTGKGFVERYMDILFTDLRLRDFVQSARENVFLRAINKKGDNEKSPDMPHTSLRIIPAKNSEAEFLQKQQDNNGYHMFTYAAEMDSWAKGVKAAGGNKDDMIRIAWDNGEYGQQFKSTNTFKGMVRLYWNVLITGTLQQVESYFKNVENGLVTRCSFTSIDNQEFALPPVWKNIPKRGMAVIDAFVKRCDERTYFTPCTINPLDLETINDDDFDKEVDWKFKFAQKREVDMSWIMPVIDKFHSEQMKLAARDIDRARDVFRRRVAVRGFRLAMICVGLWGNPRQSDLDKCKVFVDWWMHKDLECMLRLWGQKYNEQAEVMPHSVQRSVFDNLGETFTRADVYTVCMKQGIRTPVRRIVHEWKKLGYISSVVKDEYKKINKNK